VEAEDCRAALAALRPPRRPGRIERIDGGWSFWTFQADSEIARFARTDEDAARLEVELRVLPMLAERLPVAVPDYVVQGEWDGMPFGVYPMLPGRAVAADELLSDGGRLARELGAAIRALHGVPLDEVARASGEDTDLGAWWNRKRTFFDECRSRAFPLLAPAVRAAAEREIDLADNHVRDRVARPVFAHNDLGLVHILTDGTRLTGIIDWSDGEITDPAIDFVGVLAAAGMPAVEAVLRGYGEPPGDAFWERVWFLAWVSPLHDILYGLDTGDDAIVAGGVAGVEMRMRAAGVL